MPRPYIAPAKVEVKVDLDPKADKKETDDGEKKASKKKGKK
tara:strand:+ start:142 stop:264 length:123 start_codon:yes stop_codon:yes gene_type:complete